MTILPKHTVDAPSVLKNKKKEPSYDCITTIRKRNTIGFFAEGILSEAQSVLQLLFWQRRDEGAGNT